MRRSARATTGSATPTSTRRAQGSVSSPPSSLCELGVSETASGGLTGPVELQSSPVALSPSRAAAIWGRAPCANAFGLALNLAQGSGISCMRDLGVYILRCSSGKR
eukprot:2062194-Pyramimonas_sp.AAC.1